MDFDVRCCRPLFFDAFRYVFDVERCRLMSFDAILWIP